MSTIKKPLQEHTPRELTEKLEKLLRFWLVKKNKEGMYDYFLSQHAEVRLALIGALREVFSTHENVEFRQAAQDIPTYIKNHA